jgi:LysM repeat protein
MGPRPRDARAWPALIEPESPDRGHVSFRRKPGDPGYDRPIVRMSFLVSALLALAAVAAVLGAAFYMGLITTPGGVANGSPAPRGSSVPASIVATPSAAPSVAPSPSAAPSASFAIGDTYTVQPGDALSLIGEKVGVPWLLIAQANNIPGPDYIVQVGQVLIIPVGAEPTSGGDTYIVQAGDSITKIANKFNLDPTTLADFNNIVDWNSIEVGQELQIPKDNNATALPTASAE